MEKFGPQNEEEAEIFAIEAFKVDVQVAVQKAMNARNVTKEELSKNHDRHAVYIYKLFTDECSVSVRELACIAHNLNCDIEIKLVGRDNGKTR